MLSSVACVSQKRAAAAACSNHLSTIIQLEIFTGEFLLLLHPSIPKERISFLARGRNWGGKQQLHLLASSICLLACQQHHPSIHPSLTGISGEREVKNSPLPSLIRVLSSMMCAESKRSLCVCKMYWSDDAQLDFEKGN